MTFEEWWETYSLKSPNLDVSEEQRRAAEAAWDAAVADCIRQMMDRIVNKDQKKRDDE